MGPKSATSGVDTAAAMCSGPVSPETITDAARESFRNAFLSRQSILLWSVTNHRRRKRTTADAFASKPEGARTYRLRTSREVEALVKAAGHQGIEAYGHNA